MRFKRLFDIAVTVMAAIVWVPAVLFGALLILVTAGRPVFYRSNRLVDTGRATAIVKFRTMVKNAEKLVNRDTVPVTTTRFLNISPDSPLYTPAGRFLERCGLTEVPQLFHVLTGKMSIVGNRPLPTNVMDALLAEYSYATDRFLTPAGLTGPAQLIGRDSLTDSERLWLEGSYCRAALRGYRFRLDLAILASTVLIVLHLKKPMTFHGVLELIERQSKACDQTAAMPRVHESLESLESAPVRPSF